MKTKELTDDEVLTWAGGFISGLGGFQIVTNNNTPTIRFQGSTQIHREAMFRLADAMGVNVTKVSRKDDKTAYKIACSGRPLHRFMKSVWNNLTAERRRNYSNLLKQLKTITEASK